MLDAMVVAISKLVAVSMLRGINMGPHHRIRMEDLRAVYESLGLAGVKTYIQSGNVVFRARASDLERLAKQLENAVERKFGFHADVIVRTAEEMRRVVARNPFAGRTDIQPGKLAVTFLAAELSAEQSEQLRKVCAGVDEELHADGRQLYIYFPNGMARPKLPLGQIDRLVRTASTSRNWNTVTKLLAMAEELEADLAVTRRTRNKN
jgi:uncharacterized protein (DUF1697 family)